MSTFTLSQKPDGLDQNSATTNQKLEKLFKNCNIRLGGSSLNVELDDDDYEVAWETSVAQYRTLSSRSVYRSFGFVQLQQYQQKYSLPPEIDTVINIIRLRGYFGTGSAFEPFSAASANILLRNARPESGFMGVFTYDAFLQYEETISRIFAKEIPFIFRPEIGELFLIQQPKGPEQIVVECSVLKSYDELLLDRTCNFYLQNMTLAQLKIILGRKYSKFAQLPGAQGGMSLNGDKYLSEGMEEWQKMEDDLLQYKDGADIPVPIMM